MEKMIYTIFDPKNLARLIALWVIVTVFLSATTYVAPQAQASLKNKISHQEITLNENPEKQTQKNANSETKQNKKETKSLNNNSDMEFLAILNILGQEVQKIQKATTSADAYQEPVKIIVPSKNINVQVLNPKTTDIKQLDKALEKGAARYPTSGLLGESNRAIVIFGHTSYVPGFYGHYRTFNGVEKLQEGEKIILRSNNKEYVYRVKKASKISANSDINLASQNNKLILITCDGFGSKSVRWKIEADLVGVYPLK